MTILKSTFLALFLLGSFSTESLATPMHALKEADNCGGCHNPGRSQRPFFERRCTLDCQGCHVDPNGGGARNQWGYYYSHDQMNAINFFKPQDPLKDTSRADIHLDSRYIQQNVGGETKSFPMSNEVTLRVRPFINYLHLTYTNLLYGRSGDDLFRVVTEGDRRFRERYGIMVDALPLNTYLRAYRGSPTYGIKRSNHTLWIRERIGLDQFAVVDAQEIGLTPNVPFFRFSKMDGNPLQPEAERQKGTSYHGGVRGVTLAWHLNASGWDTSSETTNINMSAFGGGLNIFKLILYAEQNSRTVTFKDGIDTSQPRRVHPSSEIKEYTVAYTGLPGVYFGIVQESLEDDTRSSKRMNYFMDFHIIPFVQFEYWQRKETGTNNLSDSFFVAHLYADF